MERDARAKRDPGPLLFAAVRNCVGVEEIVSHSLHAVGIPGEHPH
jgi:hypothetical protein